MATNIGPRIGIDGEAEYRKEIQNIIQQQKTLKSEMEASASAFDKESSSKKKNAEQVKLLTKQVENQKKRVEELNKMAEASAKQTGENSTATLKWKQAVNEATAELNKMEAELRSMTGPEALAKQLDAAGQKLQSIGEGLTSVGTTLTKTVTAPIAGLGAAAIASFKEVDSGLDTMAKMTGASGEALEALNQSMQKVATTVPTSIGSASEAIGEVNTRFGVTGEQLEDLSTKFIKFADLNGTDVTSSIDNVQKVMAAYGLSIDDTGALLDTLNKVGQDTGISVSTLASSLVTNGSAMRELGMNAADSAVLLGELEKSGIDASTVMSGLAKVQQKAAKNNTTMEKSLAQALSSSTDAIDIFGAKAGPKIYEAFQNGTLSADMFAGGLNDINDALGNVDATFETTLDPITSMETTMNQLKLTGAEFGATMLQLIQPALQTVGTWVQKLSAWVNSLDESQKRQIVTIAGVVAAIGPVITVIGKLTTGIGSVISIVSKAIPAIMGLNPVMLAVVAGVAAAIAIGVTLYRNWDTIKAKASELASTVRQKFEDIKTSITSKINAAKDSVHNAIEKIKGFFKFTWKLPDLKLPHFSITGGFSLNPPSVPHISIDWYKKAYAQAVGFSSPTVIPTSSGLKGFGDGAGTEIVIGQNTLMRTISAAVRNSFGYFPGEGGGSASYTYGDTVFNIYGAPGQDVEELADIIEERLNDKVTGKMEVFA